MNASLLQSERMGKSPNTCFARMLEGLCGRQKGGGKKKKHTKSPPPALPPSMTIYLWSWRIYIKQYSEHPSLLQPNVLEFLLPTWRSLKIKPWTKLMIWKNNPNHKTVDDLTPSLFTGTHEVCNLYHETDDWGKKLNTPIKTPPKCSNKLLQLSLVAGREWNKRIQFCSKWGHGNIPNIFNECMSKC